MTPKKKDQRIETTKRTRARKRARVDRRSSLEKQIDTVVTDADIASLVSSTLPGRRMSKSMRDASEDERKWRAQHPSPTRSFRLPRGSGQLWRMEIYNLIVNDAFVKGTDAWREQILHDGGCRFRLSDAMVSWATGEFYAKMRREVYAEENSA